MKLLTTLDPSRTPRVPGPSATTVPEISCPRTAGVGNATSPLITWRSVWHTPHAATWISTSPALGSGMGISSIASGAFTRGSTTARIRSIARPYVPETPAAGVEAA